MAAVVECQTGEQKVRDSTPVVRTQNPAFPECVVPLTDNYPKGHCKGTRL